jgi:hypothetical protein
VIVRVDDPRSDFALGVALWTASAMRRLVSVLRIVATMRSHSGAMPPQRENRSLLPAARIATAVPWSPTA